MINCIIIDSCVTIAHQVLRHEEFTEAGDIEIKPFLKKKADLLQKVIHMQWVLYNV